MNTKNIRINYLPPEINWIELDGKGKIGLTSYPGKNRYLYPDALDKDLSYIKESADLLLTLMEKEELELLYIEDLAVKATENDLEWIHAPIEDFSVPDSIFLEKWPELSGRMRNLLGNGKNIVIHCWGGYGRTGTAAAMLLVDMGFNSFDAVKLVRKTRTGTIETKEQEAFCLRYESRY